MEYFLFFIITKWVSLTWVNYPCLIIIFTKWAIMMIDKWGMYIFVFKDSKLPQSFSLEGQDSAWARTKSSTFFFFFSFWNSRPCYLRRKKEKNWLVNYCINLRHINFCWLMNGWNLEPLPLFFLFGNNDMVQILDSQHHYAMFDPDYISMQLSLINVRSMSQAIVFE